MNISSLNNALNRTYGLSADNLYRLSSLSATSAGFANPSGINAVVSPSTSVRLTDYGKLQSTLSSLKASITMVANNAKQSELLSFSDNPNITATVDNPNIAPKRLAVNVSELAQSQQIQSKTFTPSEAGNLGRGSLTIESGRYEATTNSFSPSEKPASTVTISFFERSVSAIAGAINRAGGGVSARVIDEKGDGSQRLELTGTAAGANQAFRIRVADSDGNNTDSTQGLSQFSYDPTELPNVGRNQTLLRAAQDAQFTGDGRAFGADSNQTSVAVSGITLSFQATGSATLRFERDAAQLTTVARSLVSAVNTYQAQSADLQTDALSKRVVDELDRTISGIQVAKGEANLSLQELGIDVGKAGRLSFDEAKFKLAVADNAEGVAGLLVATAQSIASASDRALSGSLRSMSANTRLSAAPDSVTASTLSQPRARSFQSLFSGQTSLLSYAPTTRNLYGLAQYAKVATF